MSRKTSAIYAFIAGFVIYFFISRISIKSGTDADLVTGIVGACIGAGLAYGITFKTVARVFAWIILMLLLISGWAGFYYYAMSQVRPA